MSAWSPVFGALALGLAGSWACGDSTVIPSDSSTEGTTLATTTAADVTASSTAAGSGDPDSTSGPDPTTGADSTTGDPPWTGLRAGVAVRHLDKPIGISMAGYGARTGGTNTPWTGLFLGSRGFYALPTIKVIALESDGEQVVLLKSPLMSGESGLTDALVSVLAEQHGLDLAGRIITGATHSHHVHGRYWRLPDVFGPVGADTPDEEVIALLAEAMAQTVVDALDDLGPAQWGWIHTEDWDPADLVYSDRRHVNDFAYGKDPRLTLLAVRRPEGPPLATIINFGMHGILLGADNELITEDAAGGLEMVFEEEFHRTHGEPILGMFMQAGGGDASPRGGALGHDGIARAEMIGHFAAPSILALYDAIDWRDELALDVHSQRIDLSWEYFGYDRSDEFYGAPFGLPLPGPYTWGGWQCTSPAAPEDTDPATTMEGELKSCYPVDLLLLGAVPHSEAHQSYLSVARLDELFLVSLPGEPTHSVMQYLRSEVAARSTEDGPAQVMGIGYSQDHLLYLTHPDDWFQGGYESEMSFWGPFAAKTLVDTQLETIDRMLAGRDLPAFVEQSPSLAAPDGFTPRAFEESLDAGTLYQDLPADAERTQTVRLRFGGGDPSVGAPRVVVQVDDGTGGFTDVPSASGWPSAVLDNTRDAMITHYDPIPPPDGLVAVARQHQWYVDWEIGADLPAGTYRLAARGPAWIGGVQTQYEVLSSPLAVHQSAGASLDITRLDSVLSLTLTLPPTIPATEQSWPSAGWRVHDRTAGPSDPITVRAPLTLQLAVDGVPRPGRYTVSFDEAAGAHVFDLADAGLGPGAGTITVAASLADDIVPETVEATVP